MLRTLLAGQYVRVRGHSGARQAEKRRALLPGSIPRIEAAE